MAKVLLPLLLLILVAGTISAQTKLHPVIQGYGEIFDVPFAEEKPDPKMDYKIVVDIGQPIEDSSIIFETFDHVARMYNLHIYGGVPREKLTVVVVVHAKSTPAFLNDEAYKKKYGINNPNTGIIAALNKTGIRLVVCAQSLEKQHIPPAGINPAVHIAVSRFTAVSTYQLKGYALFKY
jgi:intracellular sulfur oxidation DsrE/DsrF family protein